MNYFAHGRDFIEDPFFLAGTALPDWMNVVDRQNRARSRPALAFLTDENPCLARLAAGVVQHHTDDAWFHSTAAFAQLSLQFACLVRDQLPDDAGFRPHFLGHILVEILLDATLIAENPDRLSAYYRAFDQINCADVQKVAEQILPKPAPNLAHFISLFSRERFLWDYEDNGKLLIRLNQVMRRVGLSPLPAGMAQGFDAMRSAVAARRDELLQPPVTSASSKSSSPPQKESP